MCPTRPEIGETVDVVATASAQSMLAGDFSTGMRQRLTLPFTAATVTPCDNRAGWTDPLYGARATNRLSCYGGGQTSGAISFTEADLVRDPRVFLVPVVDVFDAGPMGMTDTSRPTSPDVIPMRAVTGYRAVVLTDETAADLAGGVVPPACPGATSQGSCTGVTVDSGDAVTRLSLTVIPVDNLPDPQTRALPLNDNGLPWVGAGPFEIYVVD